MKINLRILVVLLIGLFLLGCSSGDPVDTEVGDEEVDSGSDLEIEELPETQNTAEEFGDLDEIEGDLDDLDNLDSELAEIDW